MNDEQQPPRTDPATQGMLQFLTSQYTTTPEAQNRARQILDRYESGEQFSGENSLLEDLQHAALSHQQALIDARERLSQSSYDPKLKWLQLAAAFGSPTRTGGFGETLGNAASALAQARQGESEFGRQKETDLLNLDQALAQSRNDYLSNQLALAKLKRQSESGLAEKALGILGKAPTGGDGTGLGGGTLGETELAPGVSLGKIQMKAAESRDKAYLPEYERWISGGAADVTKSMTELNQAIDLLEKSDMISGPMIGIVPETFGLRSFFLPKSKNVQELVETTAQRSLKEILGGQFAKVEGEQLLQRTFNRYQDEEVNRERAFRLLRQLQEAYKAKNEMKQYFEENGTLTGYKGKTEFTIADFTPEDLKKMVEYDDGTVMEVPEWVLEKGWKAVEKYRKQVEAGETPVRKQEGGYITRRDIERPLTRWDLDPLEKLRNPRTTREEVESEYNLDQLKDVLTGATAGGGTGLILNELLRRASRAKEPPGERYLSEAMGSPDELAARAMEVKRAQRMGVPMTLMESGDEKLQVLGEQSLIQGGPKAQKALQDVTERYQGSPSRVAERLNTSLKPYPYFEHLNKLTDDLYKNASPLYQDAYAKYPGIPEKDVPAFDQIMQTPDGKKAVKIALRLLRNQGKTIGKEDAIGLVYKPSLEFLDYVKRGFDQLITKEEKKGPTPLGRSMRTLRNDLRNQLDAVAPEYAAAREQYSGDLEVLDALKSGKSDFTRMQPEELEASISKMGPAEHRAFRTGVAQGLYEMINRPSGETNVAQKLIGSPEMKARLGLLFKSEKDKKLFNSALEAEMRLFEEGKKLSKRGESGRRAKIARELGEQSDMLAGGRKLLTGANSPIMKVMDLLTSSKPRLKEAEADHIAETLSKGTPREVDEVLDRLTKYHARRIRYPRKRGKATMIGAGLGAAGTIGAKMLGNDED